MFVAINLRVSLFGSPRKRQSYEVEAASRVSWQGAPRGVLACEIETWTTPRRRLKQQPKDPIVFFGFTKRRHKIALFNM